MGFGLDIAGAAAGLGLGSVMQLHNNIAGSLLGNYLGKQQAKWMASLQGRQYANQRALDWEYYKREQDYNWQLSADYARNSAKWQMEGLKDAGINPLLAISHGLPSVIQPPSASPTGGSMPSVSGDFGNRNQGNSPSVTGAIRDIASARLSTASAKTEEMRPRQTEAEIQHTLAQAALAKANAAKTLSTTMHEIERIKAETDLTKRKTEIADRPHTFVAETADWAVRRLTKAIESAADLIDTRRVTGGFRDTSHSARDNDTTIITTPTSGKSQSDMERQRQEFYKQIYRRYKGLSN